MEEKPIHIKWAGPNTPYISISKTDERIYLSKRELLALLVELKAFVNFYKEDFAEPRLSYTDEFDVGELTFLARAGKDVSTVPRIRPYTPPPEQQFAMNKWAAVSELAKQAGFDADAFANTEFCLMPFFEAVVEECARIADLQSRNFSGDNNEHVGCHAAAEAIRVHKDLIGNYPTPKDTI